MTTNPPTDTTEQKYREWLEQERPGLPPMPQDYIDSQIEAVELYLQWLNGEELK